MKKIIAISLITIFTVMLTPNISYACGGDGKSCSCMMKSEGGQCGGGCGCNKGEPKNTKEDNSGE